MLLFLFIFFVYAAVYAADINCSAAYVNSLPACDWSNPCTSVSYCFQGEFGTWGNVLRCQPGGYSDSPPVVIQPGESVSVGFFDLKSFMFGFGAISICYFVSMPLRVAVRALRGAANTK